MATMFVSTPAVGWQVVFRLDTGAELIGHYFWGDTTQVCFVVGACDDMSNWDYVEWSGLPDNSYVTFYADAACQGSFVMGGVTPGGKRSLDRNGNVYQGSLAFPIYSLMVISSSFEATAGIYKICEERGALAASANATLGGALIAPQNMSSFGSS